MFTTDAHTGGWTSRVEVEVRVEPAPDAVAEALKIQPGTEVLVRARVMYADDEPVQLATSYLPRDLTRGTPIEGKDTGPGGIYARLEEAGHHLDQFVEIVRTGLATETEATALGVAVGATFLRIHRTAHTTDHVVETNHLTAIADRFELEYRLPTD